MAATVQWSVRVDPELRERVVAEAARRDVSVSRLLGWIVERNLPDYEGVDLDNLLRTDR